MIRKLCTCLLFICVLQSAIGQALPTENEKIGMKFNKDNLVYGGNLGAQFGRYTLVQFSPQIGYRFSQYFISGVGLNFSYSSQRNFVYSEYDKFKNTYAGMNVFARVYPIQFLYLSAQPELNYNWGKLDFHNSAYDDQKLDPKFVPSFLIGGGALLGGNGRGTSLSVQYDVIQNIRSPYGPNWFISVGYLF